MSIRTNSSGNTSINLNQTDYDHHPHYADEDNALNGMSAQQLKSKLFQTIKTKGILESIKVSNPPT